MRIYGIGDSQSLLPTMIVPMELCRPIIIGIYHGQEKPDRDKFVRRFLLEAKKLHPTSPQRDCATNVLQRKCCVRIRSMICDAVERCALKGNMKRNYGLTPIHVK